MGRLVYLHDGTPCDSGSEDWRHECEARFIGLLGRRAQFLWLQDIAIKRGAAAVVELRKTMSSIEQSRKRQA
jgi:hypothetical protein